MQAGYRLVSYVDASGLQRWLEWPEKYKNGTLVYPYAKNSSGFFRSRSGGRRSQRRPPHSRR